MVWATLHKHDVPADLRRFALPIIAGALVMAGATGCSAHGRDDSHSGRAMAFVCSAQAIKTSAPNLSEASVCAMFKAEIDRALATTTVPATGTAPDGDWITVEVRRSGPATVSAFVTQRVGGEESRLPDMAVDVLDRPMGLSDIGILATQVATHLAEHAKK